MSPKFQAILDPSDDAVARISDLTPENPFYTVEYLRVRKRLGAEPCALELLNDKEPVAACLAFLTRGRLNSRIEVTSLPVLPDKDVFWRGLFDFCRRQGVSVLSAHTFASTETAIGEKKKRLQHKKRSEYRLDLKVPDLWMGMNRRHHRLVKKAKAAGLMIRRSSDNEARQKHVELSNLSLNRRRGRGEEIDYRIQREDVDAFIDCGAGEIRQAVLGDEVYSSLLVARSRMGAYAQSSGTSDDGRNLGTSHFLFYETACLLKSEGVTVFNLGGADEHSTGLQEFKLGLGSTRVDLESAEFYTGSVLKKFATKAIGLIKLIG